MFRSLSYNVKEDVHNKSQRSKRETKKITIFICACHFLTIFSKYLYYIDDFNTSVNFCLKDKINSTNSASQSERNFLIKISGKVSIGPFVVNKIYSYKSLRVLHVL